MDFEFTPEQLQLADAVRRLVEKDYAFEARKKMVAASSGVGLWPKLVELGLTALPMPEAYGGFDGTALDMLPVMQELGRGLVAEPYFATVFAAEFVKRAGGGALLEGVAEGSTKLAAALGERRGRHDLGVVDTRAVKRTNGYAITGEKTAVLFGGQADRLIVSARINDGPDNIALFVVDARADGVMRADHRVLDGTRVADVTLRDVFVSAPLAEGRAARELIEAVADHGVALLCAEAIGVMEALNAATLDYAKTRKQFGQPIARFQALQHRMVDMFVHLEQARSMAYLAAVHASSTDARERARIVSAAKSRVGQAMRYVGQQAVQIHGGMGMTDELFAAHLFKRLTMIELTLGDTDHHLARFIAASRDVQAEPEVAPSLQRAA